jgi:hypothetical protein
LPPWLHGYIFFGLGRRVGHNQGHRWAVDMPLKSGVGA